MREPASLHVRGGRSVENVQEPVVQGVYAWRLPMTNRDTSTSELDESLDEPSAASPVADDRYADVATEDGLAVYDRDEDQAWIESDTTVDLREMV